MNGSHRHSQNKNIRTRNQKPPRSATRFLKPNSLALSRCSWISSLLCRQHVMCITVSSPQQLSITFAMAIVLDGLSPPGSPAGCHVMSQNRGRANAMRSNLIQQTNKETKQSQISDSTPAQVIVDIRLHSRSGMSVLVDTMMSNQCCNFESLTVCHLFPSHYMQQFLLRVGWRHAHNIAYFTSCCLKVNISLVLRFKICFSSFITRRATLGLMSKKTYVDIWSQMTFLSANRHCQSTEDLIKKQTHNVQYVITLRKNLTNK